MNLIPLEFTVDDAPATLVTVTTPDGAKYVVKMATMVVGVQDTGVKNHLDGTPIFNIEAQVVTQTAPKANA